MKRVLSIFILLKLVTLSGFSQQEVLNLSIEQAKQYAVINNKQLRNVRAGTDIARHQYWEAISAGLPQVSASFDYTDFFNYEMEFGMMGDGEVPNINFDVLDEGDLEILRFLQGFLGGGPTVIKMQNQATAQLQFSQLIFSGQYIAGIQIAKVAKMLAEKNVERNEIDVKESVMSSYYMALITEESITYIEKNIDNLKETKRQTTALLNAGIIEPIDVDQLKMSITMLENSKRSMARNLELSYNILRIQLGIDGNVDLNLTDNLSVVLTGIDVESLLLRDFHPENNIDYRMMQTQEEIAEKMVNMERWAYAPNIAGVYSYNEKILTTEFDMNPRHLLSFRVSLPIFSSGMRNARVEQKRIELYQAQNTKEILRDNLLMQERQLRYNLLSAWEQYQSQKENAALAKRIYEHTEKKFRHGVASSLDLTQANANYLQAESNYITASFELLQAKLSFDRLLNRI